RGGEFHAPIAAAPALFLLVGVLELGALPLWLIVSLALAFLGTTFWGGELPPAPGAGGLPVVEDHLRAPGLRKARGTGGSLSRQTARQPLTRLPCCWYSCPVVEWDEDRRSGKAIPTRAPRLCSPSDPSLDCWDNAYEPGVVGS